MSNGDIPSGGRGIPMERSNLNFQNFEADTAVTKRTQILLLTILAIPTAVGLMPARAEGTALVWGRVVDGFQMALSLDSTRRLPSGVPAIRLHFRNTGNAGRNVRLNLACDRPQGYRSDLLTLFLKNSSGKSERLANTALCSGMRSYFPAGHTHSKPCSSCAQEMPSSPLDRSTRGSASLGRELLLPRVWKSALTSMRTDINACTFSCSGGLRPPSSTGDRRYNCCPSE